MLPPPHNILMYIQNSVPHLKTRLQLQQAIMKELIQRIIAEKKNSSTTTIATTTPNLPGSHSSSSSSNSSTVSVAVSISEPPSNQATPPTSAMGHSVTAVHVGPIASPTISLITGPAAIAGSKVTVGGMVPGSSTGQSNAQVFSQVALKNLSLQLPEVLRDKIAKLPPEQQKFVYMHQLRQMQQMQLKEQQLKQRGGVAGPKVVKEKQLQLIHEQQVPLVVGVAKGTPGRNSSSTISIGTSVVEHKGKSHFATMRIIPTTPGVSPLLPPASSSKRKGKGKDSNGQDVE